MAARVLVDSNILIYAYDGSEVRKQPWASEILDLLQALRLGGLSVQSLSEFFHTTTRKYKPPLSTAEATLLVEKFVQSWQVFDLTPAIVLEATRGVRAHQFSYWDALIWAAARLNQVGIVLSEDFQHGRSVEGIRFLNPFVADFSLDMLKSLVR